VKNSSKLALSGLAAGAVNGAFGGGGGMPLLLMLKNWCHADTKKAYASCVAVILPFCTVSAAVYAFRTELDWRAALPYLAGGFMGGLVGGKIFTRVPNVWLRRIFAAFLLYGGVRYLL